jgi:hypothetical protein
MPFILSETKQAKRHSESQDLCFERSFMCTVCVKMNLHEQLFFLLHFSDTKLALIIPSICYDGVK